MQEHLEQTGNASDGAFEIPDRLPPRRHVGAAAAAALVVACCAGTVVVAMHNVDTRLLSAEQAIATLQGPAPASDRHAAAAAISRQALELVRELQRIAEGDDLPATEARNALTRIRKELAK